jgi:hypothetical protein
MLSDTSTNGTCGIFQGREEKTRNQTKQLHFGDVFSLCASDDFANWKLSWQICRHADERVISLVKPKIVSLK